MKDLEVVITVEKIIGLLESIRLLEGATLSLLDNDMKLRCSDEVEWCSTVLIDLLDDKDK